MKGVAYARYSTDMQDADSIEAQLREIEKFAAQNDIQIIKQYIDEAYSGKTVNRPQFLQMIEDAKRNKFECVIVHKVDRFARDKYDSAIHKSQLKRQGVKIMYAAQPLTDSPEGHLMEGILESFAQYYSENLANEVMKGMKTIALRGEFSGGYAPLGYKIVDKKYIVEESEARAVRLIFEMHSSGKTYDEIIEALKHAGHKSRFGQDFKKNSLHSILHNEKYIGVYAFNKATSRVYGHRNSHKKKDSKDIVIVPNAIPAIIDMETWTLSQKRMNDNSKRAQFRAKEVYLLTGLIKCGECGQPLFGDRRSNGFKTYTYYRCYNKECKKVNISKEEAENFALDRVDARFFSISGIKDLVRQLNEHMRKKFDSKEKDIKAIEKSIKQLDFEIKNIINAISSGVISEALTSRLKDLEEAKKDLSAEIYEIEMESTNSLYTESEIMDILNTYKNAVESKDIAQCKKFIDKFVQEVKVTQDNIDMVLHVPF